MARNTNRRVREAQMIGAGARRWAFRGGSRPPTPDDDPQCPPVRCNAPQCAAGNLRRHDAVWL